MDLLVVEGEALLRQTLVESLQGEGLEVSEAASAEAALAVAAADGPPAVLVADVGLGHGVRRGDAALATAMRQQWGPQVGILYLTSDPECPIDHRRLGVHERCIAKPFSSAKLLRAVRDLMRNRASAAGPEMEWATGHP